MNSLNWIFPQIADSLWKAPLTQTRYGTGVHGASQKARGGVFESGVGAQINLKPLFERATPPKDGQTGDLVVITTMKEDHPNKR